MSARTFVCFVSVGLLCGTFAFADTTNSPKQALTKISLAAVGVRPIGDWQVDPAETAYFQTLFQTAMAAADSITPGPDASAQRRAVDNALRHELEAFVETNAASAYAPSIHLLLGHKARMRCGYYSAIAHYQAAFDALVNTPDPTAFQIAHEAGGALARLLVLTGRIAEFDALQAKASKMGPGGASSADWGWSVEMRRYVSRHPQETYKCGLYCLDQLGRTTQEGQFLPKNILENDSSVNGFTAADLVRIGQAAGLRVHAALLTGTNALPVPCVIHLRSDHFVYLREQRGAFFNVVDLVASGPKWMTLDDLLQEASGCVIVSDAIPLALGVSIVPLDSAAADTFRGRCHSPLPADHDDPGCGGGCDSCAASSGSTGSRSGQLGGAGGPLRAGMASYIVTEPWVNMWLRDTPLTYLSAYGPPVNLSFSYNYRRQGSVVSGAYWRGTQIGVGLGDWGCSWLSFAELSAADATVDLMLADSGWATFNFPAGSTYSTNNFLHNLFLEKQGPAGGITNLVLHYPDGSLSNYGLYDKTTDTSFNGIFYLTSGVDPTGNAVTFTYDANYYLQKVTAADGTYFTVGYDPLSPYNMTNVTSSYSSSVGLGYDAVSGLLTNITDAAGLKSQFVYTYYIGYTFMTKMATPYGTTAFEYLVTGIFDRTIWITNALGGIELYAQLNEYGPSDWPDFSSSQIPTNTPVGTLDINPGERTNRNTFYWNAKQTSQLSSLDPDFFTWQNQLRYGRTKHWLAATDGVYTHWLGLSAEQDPSPNSSTEGEVTFYDYIGKPNNVDYEVGRQINPSVIARVMPDGSTWYKYFEYLTNGLVKKMAETWMDSGSVKTRTNYYTYAANNIDLLSWTNALGVTVANNLYNAYHQIVTNYDALGQVTTNGYDSSTHQMTSSKTPAGLISLYTYNGSHRLQSVADIPVNRTNTYTWNSDGSMATLTDPRNLVVSYFWDGLHRQTGTSDARGSTTNLYYLLSGTAYTGGSGGTAILDVTARKDRLGNWTSYLYDPLRRKVRETNANGVVTGFAYCDCGSVSSITNAWNTPAQQVITLNFDNQGRLLYTTYADGYSKTNWFDSLGRITATGDGAANHWFTYNNVGLLTIRSNAYGAELTQSFDVLDRPQYVTDANGVTVTNAYDYLDRLLTRGYPNGGVERFGYSARGLTAYTNQLALTNFYAYDELGRNTYETNGNGEILKYTNNAAGDLLSLTDGKNQTTVWKYDQFGRVTNKLDQAGSVVLKYFYDAENRLTNRWTAAKGTTYYTNDAVGNLTYIKYPVSTSVRLSYDPLNRLTNMVDSAGTTSYSYTSGNQLWTEVQPFSSSTITNTYTNRVRLSLALQQPTGLWTNKFQYDPAARLTNIASWAGSIGWTLATPGPAAILRVQFPNGCYIINGHDTMERTTVSWLKNSSNTTIDSAAYGYDLANEKTAYTNLAGTYVLYTYNKIGQLSVAASSGSGESRGYGYDSAWNLAYLTNGTVVPHFTVDSKNQLTSDAVSYDSYDSNGNLTTRSNINYVYVYDDENRLIGWTNGTACSSTFIYDGLGRLRKRIESQFAFFVWSATNITEYIYDGNRVIQERDGSNNPTVSYTRGTDLSGSLEGAGGIGGLLARSSGYSSGTWSTNHFYHADANGNITYLVDNSQALAASYRYDSFGNTLSSSGPMAGANVYRFSSKEVHPNTGMYLYLYRFYDPSLQRWINRDPIGETYGINLYFFADNDPVDVDDRNGLDWWPPSKWPIWPKPSAPPQPPVTPPPQKHTDNLFNWDPSLVDPQASGPTAPPTPPTPPSPVPQPKPVQPPQKPTPVPNAPKRSDPYDYNRKFDPSIRCYNPKFDPSIRDNNPKFDPSIRDYNPKFDF